MASVRAANHNQSCARAKRHVCNCSGCGGSQHGWESWVGLANSTERERQEKFAEIQKVWDRHHKPGSTRSNAHVRGAVADFARLDVASWLGNNPGRDSADRNPVLAGSGGKQPISPVRGKSGVSQLELELIDQIETLARSMTNAAVWEDIYLNLADTPDSRRAIARDLASHVWCDLFVGLSRFVEKCQNLLEKVPDWGKGIVRLAVSTASNQSKRELVTDKVIDLVVDRVWGAFKGTAVGGFPLLTLVTREEAVRSLRILALFTCPAPEAHQEVREHSLKPLGEELHGLLADGTKERLVQLFPEWEEFGTAA
ncbi:hypothetical protein [Saccharopolyspora sp. NPDC049426]|uniref:hypothetical protein n=1 Tax=Saccharopolyspora sp. NPDC049426 TaxID=3155652 RepID=UPI00342AF7AC